MRAGDHPAMKKRSRVTSAKPAPAPLRPTAVLRSAADTWVVRSVGSPVPSYPTCPATSTDRLPVPIATWW